jgi:RNA polymerase sigma-19 factor, ECF subfamily
LDTNLTLEGIRKNDRVHFKKCFNHFYEELVVYAQGYLFDTNSSKDVVQEVFIHIWENAGNMHIKTSLRAYLYAMVRNRCLNQLKSLKITDNSKFLELNENLITDANKGPFPDEDRAIVYNRVLQIVDTMPVGMQQVFKMKFVNNYKYTEIADELGISVNTVKTQLKRAKLRISELVTFLMVLLSLHQ